MCESERSGTPFQTDRRGLSAPVGSTTTEPMTTISCALLWVLKPLLIVLVAVAWALETKRDRARRWRRSGVSQREIARRLDCSRHRVVKLLA